jgi:hypothetical protein
VDVKTAMRYIKAAQAAGLVRDGDESQLTDELLGAVVAAVRPARPAGRGSSWDALAARKDEVTAWVKDGLMLVKIGELLERSGTVVPCRTLERLAAAECGSSSQPRVTAPVADGKPGEEVQIRADTALDLLTCRHKHRGGPLLHQARQRAVALRACW